MGFWVERLSDFQGVLLDFFPVQYYGGFERVAHLLCHEGPEDCEMRGDDISRSWNGTKNVVNHWRVLLIAAAPGL